MGFIGVQPATVPLTSSDITDGIISTAKIADTAVSSAKIADDAVTTGKLPSGTIIQVKQTTKTDTFSTNSTSYTDVTGLSVSITPSSSSNKILFSADLSVGGANASDDNHVFVQMVRDSTAINIGDARGSHRIRGTHAVNNGLAGQMFHCSSCFLDSPNTTSATTYKIQMKSTTSSEVGCINRSGRDSDSSAGHDGNASSTITVMEVVA